MEKVLIVGSNGYFGSELIKFLKLRTFIVREQI